MDSFKQKKLCFQFVKVIGVEEKDEVAKGVSKHGADHQVPPPVNVRPWSREYGQDERDDGLDDVVIGLQLGNVGLHPVLFVLVVLDVVADLLSDVHVDLAVQAYFCANLSRDFCLIWTLLLSQHKTQKVGT